MSGTRQTKVQELHEATDSDLLQRWNAGDADGLGVLVARHHGWVLNLVRYVSYGEHDVEAVAQEVWLDVIRGAGSFRGTGTLRAWLETIVRRRIVTTWRARGARPQVLVGEVPEGRWAYDEGAARQVELREDLRGLLARLPEDQQRANLVRGRARHAGRPGRVRARRCGADDQVAVQPGASTAADRPGGRVIGFPPGEFSPGGNPIGASHLYVGMTNQITSHDTDTQHVGSLSGRALDGDEKALGRLHELVFAPQADVETAEFRSARDALRALGGPRLDGARPADALDCADTPWVVAYVDQLVAAARR